MTAIGATAVGVTAVRNDLKLKTIINIGSTIILWWSLFLHQPQWEGKIRLFRSFSEKIWANLALKFKMLRIQSKLWKSWAYWGHWGCKHSVQQLLLKMGVKLQLKGTTNIWMVAKTWIIIPVDNGGVSRGRSMAVGASDMWKVTCDMWHMTCDISHVTCHTPHVTRDTWFFC